MVAKKEKSSIKNPLALADRNKTPLTKNSILNFGSIAKEFNAVAIMILVERGQLNLDDPISKYNSDLQMVRKVTTRHLINYSSGIPRNRNGLIVPKNDEEAGRSEKNGYLII